MTRRFAVYLAPEPDNELWRFGSDWLGYDAETGLATSAPAFSGLSAEAHAAATAEPRLYGFHMTLKAPFRLAPGAELHELEGALQTLAQCHAAFGPTQLTLDVRRAGEDRVWLSLRPLQREAQLMQLEADAVTALDAFRAPLTPAEVARRKPERLNRRQLSYLEQFGYPFVLDEFDPHFSLTGPISPEDPAVIVLQQQIEQRSALNSFSCQSVVLFEQAQAGERFRVRRRFRLG
jgi:hypothetical protein